MRGVVDPYCAAAPEFHWLRVVPYDEFVRAFGSAIAGIGNVERVELRDPDASGRARRIAIVGEHGQFELKGSSFRTTLGTTFVRSSLIQSVNVEPPDSVTIAGAGHGHGAGLCQWGARFMAQGGSTAAQIVAFYFPGTALGTT
jgi:stage II sporulation protein D